MISWIYPVRGVQVVFGIIVLGLTAYGVDIFNQIHATSSTVNFMLFNGVWTSVVAVPYLLLAPIYLPNLAHRLIVAGVDLITMIFWFAGFIALAVLLRHSAGCHDSVCSSLQAATVFGALEWAMFTVTFALAVVGIMRPSPVKGSQPTHVGA